MTAAGTLKVEDAVRLLRATPHALRYHFDDADSMWAFILKVRSELGADGKRLTWELLGDYNLITMTYDDWKVALSLEPREGPASFA